MNKKTILFSLLLLTILLSGCVQVEVDQKIKRNGLVDISLTLKAESPMILNALKQDMEIDPSVIDRYTYEESENSVTHRFVDIDPTKERLFKKDESSEYDSSLMDKDNYNFKKEFKFPYYYYTYEIDMKGQDTGNQEMEDMFGNMFTIGYTLEVFGEIVETNGNKMADNKVKFNIGINSDKVYYVTFKDFFLSSWIGSII